MTGENHAPQPTDAFLPLRAAGLRYDVRRTALREPYAVFRWATEDLMPLACSVIWHERAWRLTAHTPGESTLAPVSDEAVAKRNTALPLVRAYLDPRDGTLACVVALRARPEVLSGDDVIDLLVLLAESFEYATAVSEQLPCLPVLSSAVPGMDARSTPMQGVTLEWPAPGWVEATAADPSRSWASLARAPDLIRHLHDWAPVGKLINVGTVAARVTALTASGLESDPVANAVDDARLLLAAVQRFSGSRA